MEEEEASSQHGSSLSSSSCPTSHETWGVGATAQRPHPQGLPTTLSPCASNQPGSASHRKRVQSHDPGAANQNLPPLASVIGSQMGT
jgi:hypothetical protein